MKTCKMKIIRKSSYSSGIGGELYINGNWICYTLELPWLWNKRNESCIPNGKYGGFIRHEMSNRWRIQLTGTKPRTAVQLHIGNYSTGKPRLKADDPISDTRGCILVGMRKKANFVGDSTKAMKRIKKVFYDLQTSVEKPINLKLKKSDFIRRINPIDTTIDTPYGKAKKNSCQHYA